MSIGGMIAAVALLVVTVAWILYPLLRVRANAQLSRQKERDALLTDYERVLLVLRDLDEDYNTGKLPQDVYDVERAQWTERGVMVLQRIEALNTRQQPAHVTDKTPETQSNADQVFDDAIEQAVANYKRKTG